MGRLPLGSGTRLGLEEHAEPAGPSGREVRVVTVRRGQGTRDGRPERRQRFRVPSLQVDGAKGDLKSGHAGTVAASPTMRLPRRLGVHMSAKSRHRVLTVPRSSAVTVFWASTISSGYPSRLTGAAPSSVGMQMICGPGPALILTR